MRKLNENKLFDSAVIRIQAKLMKDKSLTLSEKDCENISQEIVLTSNSHYLEIASIIKGYIDVSPQKRFGLARSIKGILDEYKKN